MASAEGTTASPPAPPLPCWIDGAIQSCDAPWVRVDDSAFAHGRGCYTTGRWTGQRVRWLERHVARLQRDARTLGIGELAPGDVRAGLTDLGRVAFGSREGVVRIQASRDGRGRVHLVGVPRETGPEPDTWTAILAPFRHEGPTPFAGAKVSNRLMHTLAADAAREAGVDEAILLDAEGRLVEGSRSNLFVACADGVLRSPRPQRGAVAGVAQALVHERVGGIREEDVDADALREASEIVAVNAIRGARPVVALDGRPVGDGRPGRWAARLADALGRE